MNPAAEPPATDRPPSAPWGRRLWEPCDIASVVFFRIAFAGVILSHVAMALRTDWIDYYFASSRYHLTFYGFEWVEALDGAGMRQIHRLMGAAAVGVGLGLFYRLSAVLLFGTFTYTLLSEAALYQNHYYLVSLIAFALILIPAHRAFSVDAFLFPRHSGPFIPNWCRWLLMFLVALPYTYGGIAKLNSDWLNAMPLRIWIPQKTQLPVIGPLMAESWMPWVLTYGGLVLDLAIVPLLLWRKTRVAAYIVAVLFHLLNSVLFSIDVFPWMMLLLTTIFFAPDWPRRILRRPSPKLSPAIVEASRHPSRGQRIVLGVAAVFVAFQLLFPFRHLAYPGDASWTEEGQNFSWRMMLHHKDLFLRFYARDGVTGRTVEIPVGRLLTRRQLQVIARSPEQIAAVSQFLAEVVGSAGLKQVEIQAVAITSLNGRKPQLVFDPDLNLLTVTRSWKPQAWIHPLTEPLRADPWNVPSREWAGILGVELPVTAVPPERAQPGQPGPGRAP